MEHSWSHLPDLCLLALFKYIPVSDMIRSVGRVCTNWGKVQRDELRRRTTLVIVTSDDDYEKILEELRDYDNPYGSNLIEHVRRENGSPLTPVRPLDQIAVNVLRVPDDVLTEAFTTPLMDIFPNITHLTLKINVPGQLENSVLEQVIRIINHYATKLISLRLELISSKYYFLTSDISALACTMSTLFDSINRLESLRHLTLNNNIPLSPEPQYPELSILSRLTTFTSNEFRQVQPLLTSLSQYATRDNLRVEFGTPIPWNEMISLDPKLADKFTRVHIGSCPLTAIQYENFFYHFVSLHTLTLDIGYTPMTMLARCLSQLPHLVHLKLKCIPIPLEEQTFPLEIMIVLAQCLSQLHQLVHLSLDFRLIPKGRANWEDWDSDEDDSDSEDSENSEIAAEQMEPQPEIAQVRSVRLLTLNLVTRSHLDTERLHLAQIFPNLEVLHLYHQIAGCFSCGYNYGHIIAEDPKSNQSMFVNCVHQTREPFRQCAQLHTIKLDSGARGPALFRSLLCPGLISRDNL